ncbi:hypothetical protein A3K80_09170 [Candidatus Bathyarchaeota archaeon RBG_13_38_9]|nr:MAG: hypothetical protein A3K80_09170 [Candidatus Bathyarchaeota archaeon RBG_13_38_9]
MSTLYAKDRTFHILERPWLNNSPNISCIPAKTYLCKFIERSQSGKYKNVYWVMDVCGRVGVLTHNGNLVFQTNGCLLIGKHRGILAGQPAVLSSLTALSEFVNLMDRQDFYLTIIGNQFLGAA